MPDPVAPRNRHGFKLAILCALPVEAESVRAMFDKCWEDEGQRYGKASGDKNTYTTGVIGRYNVVLILLSSMGGIPAAQAAAGLSSSFPSIELVLVVGVCGVIPVHPETKEEIILGDVVLSTAVTQYDYGSMYPNGFKRKSSIQDSLRKVPKELQGFMNKLAMRQNLQKLQTAIMQIVGSEDFQKQEPTAVYPGTAKDHLYKATYLHRHHTSSRCDRCHDGLDPTCSLECDQLACEKDKLVNRERLQPNQLMASPSTKQDHSPVVHFGRFGSGNTVMKSGADRNNLAASEGLIAWEMEGAGVWDDYPTIIVKGACDYADSHKSKMWQSYAAMMAAACLKALLAEWVVADELMDSGQSLPSEATQSAVSPTHCDGNRSPGFHGSGSDIQNNNIDSHTEHQSRNNAQVGAQDLASGKIQTPKAIKATLRSRSEHAIAVTIRPKYDFEFREPVGMCFGQAPYIDTGFFVGRESELEEIRAILMPGSQSQQPCRLVLGGIGGVGKTQLVIAYANRHHDKYTSAFWLNATTQATVEADFQKVARHIFGPSETESLSGEQAMAYVHRWLSHRQNAQWLLIFDNYDDPSQYKLQQYYPPASHGAIIITTRRPDRVAGQKVQIGPLSSIEEGVEILATRSSREDARSDANAAALAERLAGLPLALATVGAYLQASSLTFEGYRQEYEARWDVDPYDPPELQEYEDRTLYTTWSLSYERLKLERPPAAQLLKLLAYFDNQCIWYDLLNAGDHDSLDWLQEAVSSEMQFASVMRTLTNYGFVELQQSTQTWSMHNCIHDWTLAVLNRDIGAQLYQYAFECVGLSIQHDDRTHFDYMSYAKLAGHAARLVHQRIWQDDTLHGIVHKRLDEAHMIASLLRRQYRLSEAEQLLQRVLAGCEKELTPDHKRTRNTLNSLGIVYSDQMRFTEAEQVFKKGLASYEKVFGEEEASTRNIFQNLSNLYQDQGKLQEAEPMYTRILAGREKLLGPDHPKTLSIVVDLGTLYFEQGKLEKAEQLLKRALAGFEEGEGIEHLEALNSLSQLGRLYHGQGKLQESEGVFKKALAGLQKLLKTERPEAYKIFRELGYLYRTQGRLAEAERMYKRALAGYEDMFGSDDPRAQRTARYLDELRKSQG